MQPTVTSPSERVRQLCCGASFIFVVGACMILPPGEAAAQSLDVPVTVMEGDGQAAVCATSTVSGLDPNGDNFLAVRSGPGTQYRQVDQLHAGDVVHTCDGQGNWVGVFYPNLSGRSGWVHGSYLTDLAG